MGFQTGDRNAYAIINMRLFNLSEGKTILIAPQKDRSIRSMQVNSPDLTSKEIESYTNELLKTPAIIRFFTAIGSI